MTKSNLSNWLLEKNTVAYKSLLKLQSFLSLYELMSKVNTEKLDEKNINERIATICNYLVSILNEIELSELINKLEFWVTTKVFIDSGQKRGEKLIKILEKMYSIKEIENSIIVPINEINFVISKKQYPMLTQKHLDTLIELVKNEVLHNPVYIEIDENGALVVD